MATSLLPENTRQKWLLQRTAQCAAAFVIVLGVAMAAAWLSHSAWPEMLAPGFFYMKFNTSLAFIGGGVGLLAALRQAKSCTLAAGGFVLCIGGITFAEYLTGTNPGFDELLLKDSYYPDHPYPGRMAPGTALAFICAGVPLLLAAAKGNRTWRLVAMELLGFLVFALGAEGMIGHLHGIARAYSWDSYARMAPQTAAGFIALGIGLMALAWRRQDTRVARMPLWVPAVLCFSVLMLDIVTPRGVAIGIAYVPLVFCSLWFSRPHTTFVFATIATILGGLAVFAKPLSEAEPWIVIANRVIALGSVWFVAILVYLRRKSERESQASENKLRAVVDHALNGIISINEQGIVESFNPACERIFGYKAAEVLGKNVKILMPEPYHGEHDGYLSRYIATGEAHIIGTAGREVSGKRKDGTIFPMDLSVAAFQLEDGRHFSGIIRDITERKETEARMLRYTLDLERSNKELDDFAYIASHDLKEPLRGIHNHSRFLLEDNEEKLDEDSAGRLNRLVHLSQRMEKLVNDLLYFSRLGRQELAIQPTDLGAVVHDIADTMEMLLKEREVRLILKPLPTVTCDRPRITEVLRNLITNAAKYNDKPEKTIEIGFLDRRAAPSGATAKDVFYVKDNGIGIAPEFHDEVFRIFRRLQKDAKEEGTGVGLTFVKKIIERHGGKIWLESEPGQGTTFYFTLGVTALSPKGRGQDFLSEHVSAEALAKADGELRKSG